MMMHTVMWLPLEYLFSTLLSCCFFQPNADASSQVENGSNQVGEKVCLREGAINTRVITIFEKFYLLINKYKENLRKKQLLLILFTLLQIGGDHERMSVTEVRIGDAEETEVRIGDADERTSVTEDRSDA